MTVYELWDLTRPTIPSRSRLYCLAPIGVGTPAVESLTGYVARLAEAHSVTPRTLVVHELLPLLGRAHLSKPVNSSLSAFWRADTRALNGMRTLARDWVKALETQTGREDLRFLTMLTWSEVLSATGLLRLQRAWCPACYEEWRRAGQVVYEPLLWSLQVVRVCPRHRRHLQLQCPHSDCQQSQLILAPRSRPGYCSRCQRWLGALETEPDNASVLPEDEWQWQSWVVDVVGELVAAAPRLALPVRREKIRAAITDGMEQVAGGKAYRLARELHLSLFAVIGWTKGLRVPQLSFLLRVCHRFGTTPLHLLTDDPPEITVTAQNVPAWNESPSRPSAPRKRFDAEVVQRALEEVLKNAETPPPSMREIARRLGYDHPTLHSHCRDLCRAISARYLDYQKNRGEQRLQQLCGEVREATFQVHAQGLYPSAYRVALFLSAPGFIRHVSGMAAWHAALRDLGWEK